MITLTAKINLLSGENSALSLGSNNLSGNNISSNLSGIVGVKKNGGNPFIIGASKIGDGSTFSDNVDYFISDQSSNKHGNFLTSYEFEITSSQPFTHLAIDFDTVNNSYPKIVWVDGNIYTNKSPIFVVTNLSKSYKHTITISSWNKPNFPLVITGIYAEVTMEIDQRSLISINRSIFDRSDLKLPSFGIISNRGNIEFNDNYGKVGDYAEQLLLQSGLKCEIKLNNFLIDGASETIGLFETDEWDYENDNRVVSVSIKDDLEEWQNINIESLDLQTEKSCEWFYKYLWNITNKNYTMLSFEELNEETKTVLNLTYIQYPFLKSGSLWQQWTKLCQVCQLHIYKNNDGIIVCRYNGGN